MWTPGDVEKVIELHAAHARENFYAFRRMMRPNLVWGWWMEVVALKLQRFFEDLMAGKRPRLALMAPPQHGKSWTATDFIAWVAGKNPDLKVIFASYAGELGIRTNLDLQTCFPCGPTSGYSAAPGSGRLAGNATTS